MSTPELQVYVLPVCCFSTEVRIGEKEAKGRKSLNNTTCGFEDETDQQTGANPGVLWEPDGAKKPPKGRPMQAINLANARADLASAAYLLPQFRTARVT